MSDTKPKRAGREPAQSEATIPGAAAAVPATGEVGAAPDAGPVLMEALVRGMPEAAAETVAAPAQSGPPKTVAQDGWAALAEAQTALARGFEQAAVEMTGLSRSGATAAAEAAVALLGARTIAEAVEINAGLARRGVDAMLAGSAALAEIGAKAFADASRPVLTRFGPTWSGIRPG